MDVVRAASGPLPKAHVLSSSEEQGVSLSTTLQLLLLLLPLQLAQLLVRRQVGMQKHSRVPHIHVVAVFLLRRTRFLLRAANSAVGDVEAADHKSQQGRPRFKSLCNSALPYPTSLSAERPEGNGWEAKMTSPPGGEHGVAQRPGPEKGWLRPTFTPP